MISPSIHLILIIFVMNSCESERKQSLKIDTAFGDDEKSVKSPIDRNRAAQERINLSFPGTKWCGPGNTADDYDDLGNDSEVDKCCRAHDHCDNIASGEEKYGLKNNDYFTRLHCQCDKEFKQCLRSVNSRRGNYIGNFYFNLRDRCYKEQHPIVNCDEIHTKIFVRRCIRYVIDGMKPQSWQWFDLPFFDDEHDFEFIAEQHRDDENAIDDEMENFIHENEIFTARDFL